MYATLNVNEHTCRESCKSTARAAMYLYSKPNPLIAVVKGSPLKLMTRLTTMQKN